MPLKYGLISLVLSLLVVFLAVKSYEAWTRPVALTSEKGAQKKSEAKKEPVMVAFQETADARSSGVIAEKNIFSPERRDFPSSGAGSKTQVRPQITLCGIVISKDYQSASILYPGRPKKPEEREQYTVKLGETIGEYKLAKINPDRITLEAEGDSFEVPLYDKSKQRSNARTGGTPGPAVPGRPMPNVAQPQRQVPRPSAPIFPAPVVRTNPPIPPRPVIRPPAPPVRPTTPSPSAAPSATGGRHVTPSVRVPATPIPPAADAEDEPDEEDEE